MKRIWISLLVAGMLGQGAMAAERARYLVQIKPGASDSVLAQSRGMGGRAGPGAEGAKCPGTLVAVDGSHSLGAQSQRALG